MSIIGISGKINSGKDTVGHIIQYLTADIKYTIPFKKMNDDESMFDRWNYLGDWKVKKFADKLKECVSLIIGIPREKLEIEAVKNSNLPKEWDKKKISYDIHGIEYLNNVTSPMTVRTFLQLFGTEVGRQIHPDTWVNALFTDYKPIDKRSFQDPDDSNIAYPNWIITDVRFPNELQGIKDREGIVIRINRPFTNPNDHNIQLVGQHISETALDKAKFDYTINNNGTIEELVEKIKEILIKEKIL